MTMIIWMTDPHFQNEGTIDGLDPRQRLAAAIEHMNTHYADADLAVISGDLVGDDIAGDYRAMAQYLVRSKVPIYPMVGNNDDRDGFRAHLAMPDGCMADFIQYRVQTETADILCLDTHIPGSHAGAFCAARRAWLTAQLAENPDRPAYIFMHHPPMALGLPKQDEIMLQDGTAFLDLVQRHANVAHLFIGHVHRQTSGHIRGIPFATLPALSFQAPPPRPAWDWDSFKGAQEPPQYGVIRIAEAQVTLQYMQFCDYSLGVTG